MATAALPAGAVQPRDAPQIQSMRLLATAYDHNWKLKRVVPKDAVPKPRSQSPVDRSLSKVCRKSGGAKKRLQAVDAGRSKTLTGESEPSSPKSPLSPKSRKAKEAFAAILLEDDADRPPSARSEKEEEKKKAEEQKKKKKKKEEADSDDERVNKPLSTWSEEAGVPLDLSKDALEVFCEFITKAPPSRHVVSKDKVLFDFPFDANRDLGTMNQEAFGRACCRIADVPDLGSLPEGFVDMAMKAADKNSSLDIDFYEFLNFYYKFSFSEEVLICPAERLIRAAAREHDIPYDEIGKYKYVFDQTDVNKNGRVAFDEFKILITKLMKVPRGEELPERRCRDMWREATRTSGGTDLDFIVFVGWYKRYFMGDDDFDETPFEAYYHNIRRVSAYDSNAHH